MRKNKNYKFDKKESLYFFSLFVASFVYVTSCFTNFTFLFILNCIIEWPIRLDVSTCWDEQKGPAKEKALEITSVFY